MKPTLEMDLTRSLRPLSGTAGARRREDSFGSAVAPLSLARTSRRFGAHGDMPAPEGDVDRRRGLAFPLKKGGFMLASGGIIDDAAGTLEVVFTPAADNPVGALAQAWGQYAPLIELGGDVVRLNVYDYPADMMVRIRKGVAYTLRLTWHHQAGFTLSLKPQGGPAQVLRRRHAWPAYRQVHVPFSIGGMASAPRFRQWTGSFAGWVKSVKVWRAPEDAPGPVAIAVSGANIPSPFKPVADVKVLELNDPPIRPDPLRLVQLPDRISDLRKTRRVCGLDEVVGKCRGELEIFSMLTSHVGRMWPHGWYWPWPEKQQRLIFWKRGHELLPDIAAGRAGGMCGGYAHMMEEVFWSFGFDARRIQVSNHSSFEAYSNVQDRWVICDASWNDKCYMLADRDGNFLGAREIIRRHEALERDARALKDVRMMNCRDENLVESPATSTNPLSGIAPIVCYDHLGVSMNKTTELGRNVSTCRGHSRMAWYLRESERAWFQPGGMGMGAPPKEFLVSRLDDLYPSRNRAEVSFEWARAGDTLTVKARPVGVTFFDSLLSATDDGAERRAGPHFQWALHPGVNLLTVRTLNKLGAKGYPFKVRLWKRP